MTTSFRTVFSLRFLFEENVSLVILSCDYYSKGATPKVKRDRSSLRGAKRRSNPGPRHRAGLLRFARNDGVSVGWQNRLLPRHHLGTAFARFAQATWLSRRGAHPTHCHCNFSIAPLAREWKYRPCRGTRMEPLPCSTKARRFHSNNRYLWGLAMRFGALIPALVIGSGILSGCITTDMQGYADRQLPQHPIQRMVALVAAPPALVASLQSSVTQEAKKRGIPVEDALLLFPPTRTYNDAEIKAELARDGIDAVLILTVGDSGIQAQYAGTVFYGSSSGSMSATGTANTVGNMTNVSMSGISNSTYTATATPTYRYSRQTAFQARLIEATTGRALSGWERASSSGWAVVRGE